MQETLSKISQQITEYWNRFDKSQKIRIGIISFIGLLTLGIIIFMVTRPQMVNLFNEELTNSQAAEIKEVLDRASIYNRTNEDGTAIKVKKEDYARAKMALAKEEIPDQGFTFEDALKNNMGTTETEKKAKLREAKQQELAEDISNIEGVNKAEVHLVIPDEDNFFLASTQEARASVKLDLIKDLTNKQIVGIAHYVAGSVENLDVKNVRIIDNTGNILYLGDEDNIVADMDEQQNIKLAAEKQVELKVLSILGPLFDDVRVTPNLVLDFDQYKERQEKVSSPIEGEDKGIISYENKASRKVSGGSEGEEPGLAANAGEITQYQMGDENVYEAQESQSEIKYELDKQYIELEKSIGDIIPDKSNISVVVLRDKIYDQATKEQEEKTGAEDELQEGETWEEYKYRIKSNPSIIDIDNEYPELNRLVANAAGIDVDNVEIVGYEIPVFIDKEIKPRSYIEYIILGGLFLLIASLAFIIVKRLKPSEEEIETEPELSVEEMLESTQEKQEEVEPIEYGEESEIRKQIDKFVDEKPEAVASLLRNWLNEEWE
ncbi:flagellar basal-body MS-ring/collar protein FliF [Defluviitalea phaphyphila]|uniref:flagellar basal-body MS-ring/collar protein FliF n=1 Tax=Defluviitalea phaphyphila TaxID=1473580 RepID=UPI0007316195|nr:flagellar basal-body MS-ring/collar protein FliF [Defluviitalea phaphyphila]